MGGLYLGRKRFDTQWLKSKLDLFVSQYWKQA